MNSIASEAAPAALTLPRGAGVLVRKGHCILMSMRLSGSRSAPYLWQLPGGRVEDGETPLDGAHRELEEETGSVVNKDALHTLFENVQMFREDGSQFYGSLYYLDMGTYYLNSDWTPHNPEPSKHTNWSWIPLFEIPSLPLTAWNRRHIRMTLDRHPGLLADLTLIDWRRTSEE